MNKIALVFILLLSLSACRHKVTSMDIVASPTTAITNDSIADAKLKELALKNTYIDERLDRQDKFLDILYSDQDNYIGWITIIVTALGIVIAIVGIGVPIILKKKIGSIERDVQEQKQKAETDFKELMTGINNEFKEEKDYLRHEINALRTSLENSLERIDKAKDKLDTACDDLSEKVIAQITDARATITAKSDKMQDVIAEMEKKKEEIETLQENVEVRFAEIEKSKTKVDKMMAEVESIVESLPQKIKSILDDLEKAQENAKNITTKLVENLQEVESEKKKKSAEQVSEKRKRAEILQGRGIELVKNGVDEKDRDKIVEGIVFYKQALEIDESFTGIYPNIVYGNVMEALITGDKKYYKNSIDAFNDYLEKDELKNNASIYNNVAVAIERYYGLDISIDQKEEVKKNYQKAIDLGIQIAVRNLIINNTTNIEESLRLFNMYCTHKFTNKTEATRTDIENDSAFSALHGNPEFIKLLNENFDEEGKQIYK